MNKYTYLLIASMCLACSCFINGLFQEELTSIIKWMGSGIFLLLYSICLHLEYFNTKH